VEQPKVQVTDDEILYRRIPVSWYSPDTKSLSPEAFKPGKHDDTGLSVTRAAYVEIQAAAVGRLGKSYYVAILRAKDLRSRGIQIISDPQEGNPGHALLPEVNYGRRKSEQVLEWALAMAKELTFEVRGPFTTS